MSIAAQVRGSALARIAALAAAVLLVPSAGGAKVKDHDVRGDRPTTLTSPGKALSPGQQAAMEELRAEDEGELVVKWSGLTGAPSRLSRRDRPLTGEQKGTPREIATRFVGKYRRLLDLAPEDTQDLRFTRDFRTRHNGLTHLTLQQRAEGREVFGARLKMSVDEQGRILSVSGEVIPNVHAKLNTDSPALDEQAAVHAAAAAAEVEQWDSASALALVYFPLAADELRLAWHVVVDDAQSPDVWESLVDAVDGSLLWRRNQTTYALFPAQGLVYESDSPIPNTPKGTSYSAPQVTKPFHGGEFFPYADPHFDWWDGGTRETTTGNNVDAYLDRDGNNVPDPTCSSCSGTNGRPDAPGELFNFSVDLALEPHQYQDGAVTNLFYWNNRAHDFFYDLGFDEAAGNFQSDNFGLGGSGGDPVLAEAQDNADGVPASRCNANMSTPADGSSPRMQMYICNSAVPMRDGDLESVVILHEYTHGVHTRLATLGGRQYPGEGYCDYFGLATVAEDGDDYSGAYGVGDYLFNLTGDGIRIDPYSTDPSIFQLTYADLNNGSVCTWGSCSNDNTVLCDENADCGAGTCLSTQCSYDNDCTAPPRAVDQGPCAVSVYRSGELWANALLNVHANLVAKFGFEAGHRLANLLIVDALKNVADLPSMLDGRDAILQTAMYSDAWLAQCLIWDGFARMGMGYSAETTGYDDLNPLEAFDVPASCSPVAQVHGEGELGDACSGTPVTGELTVFNTGSGDLIITSVARTAGSTDISVDPLPEMPVFVSADGHVDFTVRCAPTSIGLKTATITVETNDSSQPSIELEYTCTGAEPDIATTFLDAGDFGDVCLGKTEGQFLTIHNAGNCPLSVSQLAISPGGAQFKVGQAGPLPLVIDAGDSVMVPVQFIPTGDVGAKTAQLRITSNDPDATPYYTVPLAGNAPPAAIDTFIGNAGSFGTTCVESVFKELPLTIQNNGVCPLRIETISLTGGDTGDFSVPALPTTTVLEPYNSVVVPVRFQPTSFASPTARTTTVRVASRTLLASSTLPDDDTAVSGTVLQPIIASTFIEAGDFGDVCLGDTEEQFLTIQNSGSCRLTVNQIDENPATTQFTVGQAGPVPLAIAAGGTVMVPIQFHPSGDTGHRSATVRILSNDPVTPTYLVPVSGDAPPAVIDAFIGNAGDFGDVCVEAVFKELPLTIQNNGACPLDIDAVTLVGGDAADYSLPAVSPDTILEPLNSVVVPVRFVPTGFLPLTPRTTTVRVAGRTQFASSTLTPDDTAVSAEAPPPDINVPAASAVQDFGKVCADVTATKEIPVCNTGGCNLSVTGATVDCDDFTVVAQPFPAVVSPDFCIPITVAYTPTEEGVHQCTLTITSNDPDESPVNVTLRAETPLTIIDVPESVSFLPEVVSSVDVCESKQPFPISNNGLCPLQVDSIAVYDNAEEFALEGVPSFPILLQSGHVAGAGDLRSIFAPDEPLEWDRSKSGVVRITYVDDQVTGHTTDFDTKVCGEGVLTGARVLVTREGSPVSTVERIQIQRVVGNRNRRPQLDTVAIVQNVALKSIDPEDPVCGDFQYHQEYGGVSNAVQLLPGYYNVTATIKVGTRKLTKTVGFSVNSCDFNPSVIVTF